MFVLTLTDDKLLKFVLIFGKSCVAFVWGEKLGWPRTLFIILLPSKVILRVLQSEQIKYVRRVDKKVFWIREEEESPFIQIDGEDFFTAEEIQERFGLSRTVFFNQLSKKKTHFLDSQEKSHEVTWKSQKLEQFLSRLKEKDMLEKVGPAVKRKNTSNSLFETIKDTNKTFEQHSLITS